MSFFEDLTPYTYFHPAEESSGTVNIGWLSRQHPYEKGLTSTEFQVKLGLACQRRVKATRGSHGCEFCKGRDKPRGSAEVRVVGKDRVYAAPELIHHYVVTHDYAPPTEFIAAVVALEFDAVE